VKGAAVQHIAPWPHRGLVAFGIALWIASGAASAQTLPGGTSPRFVYKADGKRLSEVLQDFAASQRVPAVVADGVEGVVNANFDTTVDKFLAAVSKAYGILTYHDGTAYYFYPAKAIQSRLFRLKGYSKQELTELLDSLGLGDKRFPLKFNQAQRTLLVYGPPRHVELVASALESLDLGAAEDNEVVVRVFGLRFASASDRTMGDTTVPGVVSTLRGLYSKGPDGASDEAGSPNTTGRKLQTVLPPVGSNKLVPELPSASHGSPQAADKTAPGAPTRGLRSPVNYDEDSPRFEADEGTNAVIVQGRAYRMREYEALVKRLDQKPMLIELEAMIIDVSADQVESLGVDWSVEGRRGGVSVTSPGNAPVGGSNGSLATVGNGVFTIGTVVADAGRQLMARINALQGEGKARVVSKPSVLGVVNRPAVMKEKRIATVRVAGQQDAKLFQVEAGTLLQVTPQVTSGDGINQIKLSLYIEDGSFETLSVDQVPVIKKTEIRTEAHVKEGESLLIGGLIIETEAGQESGVPGLRSIPVVGGLFSWHGTRASRTERMFLITPRVMGSAATPARATSSQAPAVAVPQAAPSIPPVVDSAPARLAGPAAEFMGE